MTVKQLVALPAEYGANGWNKFASEFVLFVFHPCFEKFIFLDIFSEKQVKRDLAADVHEPNNNR